MDRILRRFETLMATGADLPEPERPSRTSRGRRLRRDRRADEQGADAKQALSMRTTRSSKQDVLLPARDDPGDTRSASSSRSSTRSRRRSSRSGAPVGARRERGRRRVRHAERRTAVLPHAGAPPKDAEQAVLRRHSRSSRRSTGRQTYYNSGIIPYEGPQGNTFRVAARTTDIEARQLLLLLRGARPESAHRGEASSRPVRGPHRRAR